MPVMLATKRRRRGGSSRAGGGDEAGRNEAGAVPASPPVICNSQVGSGEMRDTGKI